MADESMVYVIDNDSGILESFEDLLSSHGYQVATFDKPEEFLSFSRPNIPACLILDLKLGTTDGLAVQQQLAGDTLMPVIFVSKIIDIQSTVKAMRGGASEFLLKPVDGEQLLSAVRTALRQARKQWADSQLVRRIRRCYDSLTPREREVLPFVVSGFLNKQTAHELGTSEITIRIHRGQIMKKMNASSLAELVWFADRLGIPDRTSYVNALIGAEIFEALR
jgi:FixJ family two-component response regulator